MSDYKGAQCPVCNELFDEKDDIVVCPECGAPYHRKCYNIKGECIFKDKHRDENYRWVNPSAPADDIEIKKNKTLVCYLCGNKNPDSATVCERCGSPLAANRQEDYHENISVNNLPFIFDLMGGVSPDEDFNGVKASSLAEYIKVNTSYYLSNFKKLKLFNKTRFNFSAFLFSGIWFLYRKQYKWGIITTFFMFLMVIGSIIIDGVFNYSITSDIINKLGVDLNSVSIFSPEVMNKVMIQVETLTSTQKFMLALPTLMYILEFAVMILVGVFGNRLYLKHCTSSLQKIEKQDISQNDKKKLIQKRGGVNFPLASCLIVCYFIIVYFLPYVFI